MILTNAERAIVSFALYEPWTGTEEQLLLLDEIHEKLRIQSIEERIKSLNGGQMLDFDNKNGWDPRKVLEVDTLSKDAAELLLLRIMQKPAPVEMNRSKISLIRKLREVYPKEKAKDPEPSTEPVNDTKGDEA